MEGIQVIEKSIPCAKCQNQLLKYQAASKQIKNAINPLMLDQKSPPWFQKHDARCRSGITVNLCYYKCAFFFPRSVFTPLAEERIGSSVGCVLQSRLSTGLSQFITVCFSGNIDKAGDDYQEGPFALGQDRSWCHCQGIWCPRFPRQVHKSS